MDVESGRVVGGGPGGLALAGKSGEIEFSKRRVPISSNPRWISERALLSDAFAATEGRKLATSSERPARALGLLSAEIR